LFCDTVLTVQSLLQDSTNVYTVDECAEQGWYDEPISFKARKSLDFVVQIWAYRYIVINSKNTADCFLKPTCHEPHVKDHEMGGFSGQNISPQN